MLPSRYGVNQPSSSIRKSRLEAQGKPSLLPKLRRPSSIDRLSSEARRPSATGRSSSADPPRATFRRETSTTKVPLNSRSRSQQGDRYGQSSMTPLRSSTYGRATVTPRTPSEDRANRGWQASLDRALAFVTVKDQRTISNVAWQRAEYARMQEWLNLRGVEGGRAPMALMKPLTIARFLDITGSLLAAITKEIRLNNDNYVTKLPHIAKRLLYPGTLSKSWLKTVNALHAFPQALALIGYLVDLVSHIEMPVTDEWLYQGKDDLARLRRDYLNKCWIRFQTPNPNFDDFTQEYLQELKVLLGNDEKKIEDLKETIKKYKSCLEDEAEAAARADEASRVEKREALLGLVRGERAARKQVAADVDAQRAAHRDKLREINQLDTDIERANGELNKLKTEVECQPMSVEERAQLKAEIEYKGRVIESKRAVIAQIEKLVSSKKCELANWQTSVFGSCQEYAQGLIPLSAQFPDIAHLAIDEKELMGEGCVARVCQAVEVLRLKAHELAEKRALIARNRNAHAKKIATLLEESHSRLGRLRASVEEEQRALDSEAGKEAAEALAHDHDHRELTARLEELKMKQGEYANVDADLRFWQDQEAAWRVKLSEMQEFIRSKREESKRLLEEGKKKRIQMLLNYIHDWNSKIPA